MIALVKKILIQKDYGDMTKLTIIGAAVPYLQNIVVDLLTIDQFKTIEIALMDVDKNRLIKTKVLEIISKK